MESIDVLNTLARQVPELVCLVYLVKCGIAAYSNYQTKMNDLVQATAAALEKSNDVFECVLKENTAMLGRVAEVIYRCEGKK
jgi:hypothetical protein